MNWFIKSSCHLSDFKACLSLFKTRSLFDRFHLNLFILYISRLSFFLNNLVLFCFTSLNLFHKLVKSSFSQNIFLFFLKNSASQNYNLEPLIVENLFHFLVIKQSLRIQTFDLISDRFTIPDPCFFFFFFACLCLEFETCNIHYVPHDCLKEWYNIHTDIRSDDSKTSLKLMCDWFRGWRGIEVSNLSFDRWICLIRLMVVGTQVLRKWVWLVEMDWGCVWRLMMMIEERETSIRCFKLHLVWESVSKRCESILGSNRYLN